MHGATQPLVKAVFPGEGLAHHSVEQEVYALLPQAFPFILYHPVGLAAKEALHDGKQLALLHYLYGAKTLGQYLAMAAVGAEG